MTRFQRELSGELGEFWKKHAEEELDKVRAKLEEGKITIDAKGVARNCIGRGLMDDLLEQLSMVTDKVNVEATRAAREAENAVFLAEYRARSKSPSAEELVEMRAAFGPGATVTDVITGEKITIKHSNGEKNATRKLSKEELSEDLLKMWYGRHFEFWRED